MNCITHFPPLTLTTNQKSLNPLIKQQREEILPLREKSNYFSFFLSCYKSFIFLFDAISKSVRKSKISCKALVWYALLFCKQEYFYSPFLNFHKDKEVVFHDSTYCYISSLYYLNFNLDNTQSILFSPPTLRPNIIQYI